MEISTFDYATMIVSSNLVSFSIFSWYHCCIRPSQWRREILVRPRLVIIQQRSNLATTISYVERFGSKINLGVNVEPAANRNSNSTLNISITPLQQQVQVQQNFQQQEQDEEQHIAHDYYHQQCWQKGLYLI